MTAPYYWDKTNNTFPAIGGSPTLIDEDNFVECCCIEFTQAWMFTDHGFIDGGQGGAYRAYGDPSSVPASPWDITLNGRSLRLDWEDDKNCKQHNPNTQTATATAIIVVPVPMTMEVNWTGMGETEAAPFELMECYVNDVLIGAAHAPGGGDGCDPMGPVVSDPPPPHQTVLLPTGPHVLFIDATTRDALYHYDAWYKFELSFNLI